MFFHESSQKTINFNSCIFNACTCSPHKTRQAFMFFGAKDTHVQITSQNFNIRSSDFIGCFEGRFGMTLYGMLLDLVWHIVEKQFYRSDLFRLVGNFKYCRCLILCKYFILQLNRFVSDCENIKSQIASLLVTFVPKVYDKACDCLKCSGL